MSHQKIWLSAACILFLVGCGSNPGTKPEPTTIDTPVLTLNDSNDGLTWEDIDGARSYEITVDEETTSVDIPGYLFSTEYGDYEVSVVAVDKNGNKSEAATYSYETRVTRLGNLQFDGTKISWPGSDYFGLETSCDGVNYTPITDTFLPVEKSAVYYFRTVNGFREDGHVYFCHIQSRCIIATLGVATPYIIEDGTEVDDATLNEYYRKTKYTSGWEVAASYLTLDYDHEEYVTENGVDFHTWYHGNYYMFEKQIKLDGSYNEFDFTAMASDSVAVTLSFQITHTMIVNGIDLNGVYMKYEISTMPTLFHKYRVSMNDSNWRINYAGSDYKFSEVATLINAAGVKVSSISDMFPFFDVFQFRIKAAYAQGGSSAHAYFDDVQLLNSDLEATDIKEIIPTLTAQPYYAFKGSMCKGGLTFSDETHATMRMSSPFPLDFDCTYEIADEVLTLTCATSGMDFVAKFDSPDGGYTLNLISATGSFGQYLAGVTCETVKCLDDYESYSETGVGYDLDHPVEERSGLRGAYLCDQYVGGSATSPLGGKGWSLMNSNTNYMSLDETSAHTGTKALSLINDGLTNRFMQWGLFDASLKGIRGKTLSIWVKGGDKADMTLRLGIYFVQPVGPSNHAVDSARKQVDFTIPKNSGWKEYTYTLDSNKVYYGVSMLTLGNKAALGDESQRILVDDIYIYNTMSPWAA